MLKLKVKNKRQICNTENQQMEFLTSEKMRYHNPRTKIIDFLIKIKKPDSNKRKLAKPLT